MSKWRRLLDLSSTDIFLLLLLWIYLHFIVVGLRCAGFTITHRMCQKLASFVRYVRPAAFGPNCKIACAKHYAELVSIAAGRCLMEAVCLPKSIALKSLLRGLGFDPQLCVGVAKDDATGFHAHAWVELDNVRVNESSGHGFRFYSISKM